MSKVVYEGWMVRCGRRKIGTSFIHLRYFVLESRLLAYYKKKPQDRMAPIKMLVIDGNCRVEDRGLEIHHGHMVYVLCVYNKKEYYDRITVASFNIQDALTWKEKIEHVIDQHQDALMPSGSKICPPLDYKSGLENGKNASSDHESQGSCEDEEEVENHARLMRRTTTGNGPPDSLLDWTREINSGLSNQSNSDQVFSRKHWRLIRCQNGLQIFEELLEVDYLLRSCSRAMKAVGIVEASCESIFELIMSMDQTRYEWDCSFSYGCLVEEVDGHTAIIYHRLQLDWYPLFVWPRDLVYVRYWRRNDDGSFVVLFQSREYASCGPQPGFVRAHIKSGGFHISPLKSRYGRLQTQVQHLMQIDLKGWGVGYLPSFQQQCSDQMLNSVAGLRQWFSQRDTVPRIPVMVNMTSDSVSSRKGGKTQETSQTVTSLDQMDPASGHPLMLDECSDDDENYAVAEAEQVSMENSVKVENDIRMPVLEEETSVQFDLSSSGNLRRDDRDNSRDCWRLSSGNNFRVRSQHFIYDKTKIPAGKHLMEIVAVDWFKDVKRMDHVVRRQGCAVQVASEKGLFSLVINMQIPGSTNYSMVFYFVSKQLVSGSLLQRFVDGDDEFRNSRFKLIPSVPKGSWIVRQSVGSTHIYLGKAVDCTYIRGPTYLEIDVDIGSSKVANGVLGLMCGVITTWLFDMAFLVQANTNDELPERLIGAVRVSHVELSSAVTPILGAKPKNE